MKPQDRAKIDALLAELNTGRETNPLWKEVVDVGVLIKIEIPENGGDIKFFGNSGFPVKAFINIETGELKLYTARRFEQD